MRIEYFQLITRVEELDLSAGTIRAIGDIPSESTIFEGHFPGYPIMPGVLLIESMAQTSGHLILAANNYTAMPFLAGVRNAKLRHFVGPGNRIVVTAQLEHVGSAYVGTRADVTFEGKKVAEAEIRFATMPFPSDAMKATMLELVGRLGLPKSAAT